MEQFPVETTRNGIKGLISSSLKSASMDHGLQYNAIYWETGHRTYLPFWSSMRQKFTWKIIDDQVRNFLGIHQPISKHPFVFYGNSSCIRRYYGDSDLNLIVPLKRYCNFSFSSTGVEKVLEKMRGEKQISRTEVFSAILDSALKNDWANLLKSSIDATL
ncbi:hypothetical protein IE077_003066 [Cardiosporidium cionae]|uniref:Uncharacterized protein n=1 Tax=Cardiosporidium cionae TaxID=476202 RepID=A0ABQ7JF83_9APIC|nr:hypothetical protein IE077_003066 [Cardiosporidium cionae]|eukprot:KAF8822692.1 hypothetical protein IE077_003066 [Cardiosporidium cionae]